MTKKYVTPEVQVVTLETAPLLAASNPTASGEGGKWSGLTSTSPADEQPASLFGSGNSASVFDE